MKFWTFLCVPVYCTHCVLHSDVSIWVQGSHCKLLLLLTGPRKYLQWPFLQTWQPPLNNALLQDLRMTILARDFHFYLFFLLFSDAKHKWCFKITICTHCIVLVFSISLHRIKGLKYILCQQMHIFLLIIYSYSNFLNIFMHCKWFKTALLLIIPFSPFVTQLIHWYY